MSSALHIEPAIADHGYGDANEGEEMLGLALVATVQAAAAIQPGLGAFDDPATLTQAMGTFHAAASDARHNLSAPQPAS